MDVLLSIKPKYVKNILQGIKKYEFRKQIFRYPEHTKVYMYSSSPDQCVVGYFCIENIIHDHVESLWEKCQSYSGINKEDFFAYFAGKEFGYAIKIGEIKCFSKPLRLDQIGNNLTAPQSYQYLNGIQINTINKVLSR